LSCKYVYQMTTAARPRRLLHPLGCLCFLVVAAFAASISSAAGRVVTSLPGFDGDLPFHLETGYVEVDEDAGVELFYYFVRSESESESGDAPF
ncbi:hypothetical protein INO48_13920, partial [Staphylococcus aureus]|nr:hypothetical protein [Staphylococcus aureus]